MKNQLRTVLISILVVGASCGSGPSVEAFCAKYEELDELTASTIDPADPDALEAYFTDMEQAFADRVSAAPDEIRADSQTLADAFDEIMAALRAIDFDPGLVDPTSFESLENNEASNRVDGYYSDNCAAIR